MTTEQACFPEDKAWVKPVPICNECSTVILAGMKKVVDDERDVVYCSERCKRIFEQRPGRG